MDPPGFGAREKNILGNSRNLLLGLAILSWSHLSPHFHALEHSQQPGCTLLLCFIKMSPLSTSFLLLWVWGHLQVVGLPMPSFISEWDVWERRDHSWALTPITGEDFGPDTNIRGCFLCWCSREVWCWCKSFLWGYVLPANVKWSFYAGQRASVHWKWNHFRIAWGEYILYVLLQGGQESLLAGHSKGFLHILFFCALFVWRFVG